MVSVASCHVMGCRVSASTIRCRREGDTAVDTTPEHKYATSIARRCVGPRLCPLVPQQHALSHSPPIQDDLVSAQSCLHPTLQPGGHITAAAGSPIQLAANSLTPHYSAHAVHRHFSGGDASIRTTSCTAVGGVSDHGLAIPVRVALTCAAASVHLPHASLPLHRWNP